MKMQENLNPEVLRTMEAIPSNDENGDQLENVAIIVNNTVPKSESDLPWDDQMDTIKQRLVELQEHYDQSYLEIGRLLIQARDVYKGHGDWIKWLKENAPFSVRHAQRLIRIAEMFDDETLVSDLDLTASKAYVLTRVGKNDIGHFTNTFFSVAGEKKLVKDMTRRELELVVAAFLRGKLPSANHKESASNQGVGTLKENVESNLVELKMVLNKTIASIKNSDSDIRDSWISELDELYKAGLDELTSVSV